MRKTINMFDYVVCTFIDEFAPHIHEIHIFLQPFQTLYVNKIESVQDFVTMGT